MADGFSIPITSTLDTEMIVRFSSQRTLTGTGFQQSLRQRDTGWDMVSLHFLYRQFTVFLDVIFVLLVASLCLKSQATYNENQEKFQFFHGMFFIFCKHTTLFCKVKEMGKDILPALFLFTF
jgi:hypothetical protein